MLKFSNIIHENAEHISNFYLAQDSERARCQEMSLTSLIVPEKKSVFSRKIITNTLTSFDVVEENFPQQLFTDALSLTSICFITLVMLMNKPHFLSP